MNYTVVIRVSTTESHLKLFQYHRTILHMNIIEKLKPLFSHWETLPVNFWFYCKEVRGIHTGCSPVFPVCPLPEFLLYELWLWCADDGASKYSIIFHWNLYGWLVLCGIQHTLLTWHENLAWCIIKKHTYFKYHSLKNKKIKWDMYAYSELNNFAKKE